MHEREVKSILSADNGMNLYRGCTHGCIYCDARSACYQMKHEFEDIEVKSNAVQLLEQALKRKRKKCMIGTGAMSDPYVHAERDLKHTRKCLELIAEYEFGVTVLTKSDMILRDLDLLRRINSRSKCIVQMTMTTYDEDLCRIVEPHVCTTRRRAEVLRILKEAGIPTVVWMTPILPFINDTEENLEGLLNYCRDAKVWGIISFGLGMTLRDGDREYFYKKLDQHFPGLKEKYIRTYGNAYHIPSKNSRDLMKKLRSFCGSNGIVVNEPAIFEELHAYEDKEAGEQLSLFS